MKAIIENTIRDFKSHFKASEIINLIQSSSWILNNNGDTIIGNLSFEANGRLILSTIDGVKEGKWEVLKINSQLLITLEGVKVIWVLQVYNECSIIFRRDLSTDLIILASQKKFDVFSLREILETYVQLKQRNDTYRSTQGALNPFYKYHVVSKSQVIGPYDVHELKKLVKKGKVNQMCYVKKQSESDFSAGLRVKDVI